VRELCVGGGEDGGQPKILLVGLGLGEFLALAREACPTGVSIEVIEEYATVVEAARLYGALADPAVATFTKVTTRSTEEFLDDAKASRLRFDLALVDCMSADGKVPYACRGPTFAHLLGCISLESIQLVDDVDDLALLKEDYTEMHDWYHIETHVDSVAMMLTATSATMRTFYGGGRPNMRIGIPFFILVTFFFVTFSVIVYDAVKKNLNNLTLKPRPRVAEQGTLYTTLQEEGGIAMTSSAREPRFTAG
jgi:hypothetical protein